MPRFQKEISLVTLSPTPHRFNWFVRSRIVLTNTHDLVKAIISTLEERFIDFSFTFSFSNTNKLTSYVACECEMIGFNAGSHNFETHLLN